MADSNWSKVFTGVTELRSKQGNVPLSTLNGKYVAVYFSAHWCGPCRNFTPRLAGLYDKLKAKNCEIVFLSSDRDQSAYESYYKESHPWLSVDFKYRELKAKLSSEYGVRGIPCLVLLDKDGTMIRNNIRNHLMNNFDGFPWKPQTFDQLKTKIVNKKGEKVALKADNVALYFSAHWCPPCKAFTPILSEVFKKVNARQPGQWEVVFVSRDSDKNAMTNYYASMADWYTIPYEDSSARDELAEMFGVEGIPQLTMITRDGTVVKKDLAGSVRGDKTGEEFPWPVKPVYDLSSGELEGINSKPSLVLFIDGRQPKDQAQLKSFVDPIAAENLKKRECYFFTNTDASTGVAGSIRNLCGKLKGDAMILLDLADNGAFYQAKLPQSEAEVRQFWADYKGKKLTRQQCQR